VALKNIQKLTDLALKGTKKISGF